MADVREVFPVLVNASDEGVALSEAQAGQAAAGKVGSVGFAYKDSGGNLVLPQLTADGKVPVSTEPPGVTKYNRGENAGSLTTVTIATVTLVASKKYKNIEFLGSCFRDTLFQVIQLDDAAETVLAEFLVGPGQYTFGKELNMVEITAGATGTQSLLLKAINIQKASTIRGTIGCLELG